MDYPFVGPTYLSRSRNVDAERCINLIPEAVQSENGKAKAFLLGSPGKSLFGTVSASGSYRGAHVVFGSPDRLFAVLGITLYEIFSDGTSVARGTLRTVAGFVSLDNSPTQLMLTDGPNGYVFDLISSAFQQINAEGFLGGDVCAFIDDTFAANQPGTINWALSGLSDATAWDGLDHAAKEGSPDPIVSLVNLHRQLVFFGKKSTEVWYDTGASTFPYSPIPGVFIEKGCDAPFSVCKLDNTAYWVGSDANGKLVVYKMEGYTPKRVSNPSIEYLLGKMGDPSQLVAYSYQEEGHDFYVINSLTASTTLVYDASTEWWHERMSFNEAGVLTRDRANFHAFVFDQHLLFDFTNSNIYASSLDVYTSNGLAHPRIRIGPHTRTGLKRVFFKSMQVDMETGVGLDGSGQGVNPVAILKISNNGGKSWGPERTTSIGAIGKNKTRARWTQLGSARDRVFWFEIDDPVKVALIESEVDFTIGLN